MGGTSYVGGGKFSWKEACPLGRGVSLWKESFLLASFCAKGPVLLGKDLILLAVL